MENVKVNEMTTHIPNLKFHPLTIDDDRPNFEVNTYGCDVRTTKYVVGESYQQ